MPAKPVISLVVPALAGGGGVPSVARFLTEQIMLTGRYQLEIVSLPTSARDPNSLRLLAPSTWFGNPRSSMGKWEGRTFTHVGAVGVELEFQRYRPRRILERTLAHCDLIQIVAGSPAIALAVGNCRQPIVLQVATRSAVERAQQLGTGALPLRWWRRVMTHITDHLDDVALRRPDTIFVENDWMCAYAKRLAGAASTVIKATPGVNCDQFFPIADRATSWPKMPYILFVGRLSDPRKNVVLLCSAYVRLCQRMNTAPRLVIAGQGDLPAAAEREIRSLRAPESVTIVPGPETQQLIKLYQGAACLAVPSTEEGFGMVVIEAMASGIPVISTRCGGPEEIISHGQNGYLVAPGDPDGMAKYLAMLCSDVALNVKFGHCARATAAARYSDKMAVEPFLQAYDRLLHRA
jgi:D-inositol-3-phosphate glycosyltransferase